MTDECEECGREIADDPDKGAGERPRSQFDESLCIICGNEAFMEREGIR